GLYHHLEPTLTREEDDRHLGPAGDELLQVEAAEAGKYYVEHHAARGTDARLVQELRGRRERLRLPTTAVDQDLQGLAHGRVAVDDEHDGSGRHAAISSSRTLHGRRRRE